MEKQDGNNTIPNQIAQNIGIATHVRGRAGNQTIPALARTGYTSAAVCCDDESP